MVALTLGALTFNGANLTASGVAGSTVYCTDVEGWDSPELRQTLIEAAAQHGGVYVENRYGWRRMALKGVAIPASGVDVSTLDDFIAGELNTPSGKTLTVHEAVPKITTVRRAGLYLSRRRFHRIEFEVELVAADPRKYSETAKQATITVPAGSTWSDVLVRNDGNFPSFPDLITISGEAGAPIELERADTGQKIVLQSPITTSRYLIYPKPNGFRDVLWGAAGSETSRYDLVDGATRWWDIINGANMGLILRRPGTTGTLTAVIDYRDSWI